MSSSICRTDTILQCAELVLKVTGSSSLLEYKPLPQDDPKQRRPDISKARRMLAWEPKIDLEHGLRLSMEYFRDAIAKEGTGERLGNAA